MVNRSSSAVVIFGSPSTASHSAKLKLVADLGKNIEAITAASVHVVLNNNYEDQGQRTARTLMRLVAVRALPTPRDDCSSSDDAVEIRSISSVQCIVSGSEGRSAALRG